MCGVSHVRVDHYYVTHIPSAQVCDTRQTRPFFTRGRIKGWHQTIHRPHLFNVNTKIPLFPVFLVEAFVNFITQHLHGLFLGLLLPKTWEKGLTVILEVEDNIQKAALINNNGIMEMDCLHANVVE